MYIEPELRDRLLSIEPSKTSTAQSDELAVAKLVAETKNKLFGMWTAQQLTDPRSSAAVSATRKVEQ